MEISRQNKQDFNITFILSGFEERNAVLVSETAGNILWPIRLLPEEIKVGDPVTLRVLTQKQNDEEKYASMRRLLEELIN